MIESFTVENFCSYKSAQTLSFLASKRELDKDSSLIGKWYKEIDDNRILKLLVLVGDNGAGKSKLLNALNYLKMLVVNRQEDVNALPPYHPFQLDHVSTSKTSNFSLVYYIADRKYRYSVSVSAERIEREELIQLAGRHSAYVFTREYNPLSSVIELTFGNACDLSRQDQQRLSLMVQGNSTVLSVFNWLNISSEVLNSNYSFFKDKLGLVHVSQQTIADKLYIENPHENKLMHRLMQMLFHDLTMNISDYIVSEIPVGIQPDMPPELIKMLLRHYPNGKQRVLQFIHSTPSGKYALSSEAESNGTLNIVRLMILIYDIIIGDKISMSDEFGNGLDLKAFKFLFKMYLTLADDSQLIIATQNHEFMDAELLRRDSVRLIKKSKDGESTIIPVNQSKLHRNMSLVKYYGGQVNPELEERLAQEDLFDKYISIFEELS